jgi:hypothetical protein
MLSEYMIQLFLVVDVSKYCTFYHLLNFYLKQKWQ